MNATIFEKQKDNCRVLWPQAETIWIQALGRHDADLWAAQAVGYPELVPDVHTGAVAVSPLDPLPEGAWILTQALVRFPDRVLEEFYEGPAKNCKEINLYAAAVWALYRKTKELLKEMKTYNVRFNSSPPASPGLKLNGWG
jgi:hypothetical protein